MGDVKNGYQATPNATLEQQMMDACAPKNEREWWAFAEIGRLRADVEALRADADRLDCGQIMIDTRDEFGDSKQVWHTGMNLRAAIDAARAAQGEKA